MQWKFYLSPPEMSGLEREMLMQAFDSGWIAPAGPDLAAFEGELKALSGAAARTSASRTRPPTPEPASAAASMPRAAAAFRARGVG